MWGSKLFSKQNCVHHQCVVTIHPQCVATLCNTSSVVTVYHNHKMGTWRIPEWCFYRGSMPPLPDPRPLGRSRPDQPGSPTLTTARLVRNWLQELVKFPLEGSKRSVGNSLYTRRKGVEEMGGPAYLLLEVFCTDCQVFFFFVIQISAFRFGTIPTRIFPM